MASSSSPSSSSSGSWKYDVFLSFRGEDTRKTFVDHLYHALEQHRILTYKDDVTLARGDTIRPSLMKAIESSQISVIIFSENYADSSWCLDELSYIMKCRDSETGQIVMPIFYHVDPSDVRKQKRKYGEAFAKHELSENGGNKVESWKKALVDASNIAGWEPKHVANGHEAKCIQEIVDSILGKLSSLDSVVEDEELVGMETRLKDLKSELRIESGGVRMVGIWGIGGGGKTTLATSLYMEIFGLFDGCCFLDNIREESGQNNGLKNLQEKLLSAVFEKEIKVQSVDIGKHTIKRMLCRRNVLIVLDDVDHLEQLEALAGCHNWFGNGSRIIITTRDEQVLKSHRVDKVCHVSLLSRDEAIQLFKRYAYVKHNPVEDYENLSLRVISYVNGLPLALKILGAFLSGKDKDEWLSTLDRLKYHPEMEIVQKLKISYDGLKLVEKELFLDIACFFRREKRDRAMKILDFCGFYPRIGVKVLIQKALISVSKDGKFDMHDLVQEMAHYIVRGEHPHNPENYSRLWRKEDIEDICSRNATMENDKIEAIQYHSDRYSLNFIMLASNMKKLRFLKVKVKVAPKYRLPKDKLRVPISSTTMYWGGNPMKRLISEEINNSFDEGPSFLSNELRYIDWNGYPASPFPESIQLRKLLVLKMEKSLQKELWKGYKYLPCLKVLKLSFMKALVRTPDFGGLPCLRNLKLWACDSLEEIHQSLGDHSSLVSVFVRNCDKLTRFPTIVGMDKLECLGFLYCKAFIEFPEIKAKMDNLVELSLSHVGIEILPSTIREYCTNLISLRLNDCSKFRRIDGNLHALKVHLCGLVSDDSSIEQLIRSFMPCFVTVLDLSRCELKDGEIPNEIGELSNLRELDLACNSFTRLDFSLSRLTCLKILELSRCYNLVELPELPSSLAILKADCCYSLKVIKDDAHRRCKWLCEVSISGGGNNTTGGERLLESMLQGNAIKSGCMILDLNGSEIWKGFEPRLFRGERQCRMQLPENWYNDFSGFLFCATLTSYAVLKPIISLKHVEKSVDGSSMGITGDSEDDDLYWGEEKTVKRTCVVYFPFFVLRHTSWWDPTSTAVEMEFHDKRATIRKCGMKLVPKGAAAENSSSGGQKETTPITHTSSSDDEDDYYKCKLRILHDSKSAFKFKLYERL